MFVASSFSRAQKVLLVVLLLWCVGSVTYAIKAEKPWGKTVTKRLEKHQELQPKEYEVIGLWWGAVVNAGVLVLMLGTGKLWMPEEKKASVISDQKIVVSGVNGSKWWVGVALLGIFIFAGWLRAPRLTHSLWNDEEYAMRKFAHGGWELGKDGQWAFEPVSWTDTLFENRNGNNHLLNSLITREALAVWRTATHAPRETFSEAALRMPAFIAGLLTIGMIFVLGCRLGEEQGAWLGLSAALLLALCPWHIRYAVEAKGYSFMLLFVCTAIYGLLRALEENRVRWWMAFAVSESAFLLSFAGSIYVAMALNLFAMAELARERKWGRVGTLAAFNFMAAAVVLQWMLPSVPQLMHYLKSERSLHLGLGWPWIRDFLSGLAVGFQYDNVAPGEHAGTSWLMETEAHAWLASFMGLAALLMLLGMVLGFFRRVAGRLAIVAPTVAVVAAYAHNALAGTPMVVWYLLYIAVPAALAIPLGLLAMMNVGKGSATRWGRVAGPWAMVLFLTAYAGATWGAGQRLRLQPRQPMREAVVFVHEKHPQALTAVLGVSDRQIQSYDPQVTVLDDRKELGSLIAAARGGGHPLLVYVCGEETILRGTDDKVRAKQSTLEAVEHGLGAEEAGGTAAAFTEEAQFSGTEAMFSYRVYRLSP